MTCFSSSPGMKRDCTFKVLTRKQVKSLTIFKLYLKNNSPSVTFRLLFRTELLFPANADTEAFWTQPRAATDLLSHQWVCTERWLKRKITPKLNYAKQAGHPSTNHLSLLLSKSPESATTVVNFFSCSKVEAMFLACRKKEFWRILSHEMSGSAGSQQYSSTCEQRFCSKKKNGGRSAVDKRCGHRRRKGLYSQNCFVIRTGYKSSI